MSVTEFRRLKRGGNKYAANAVVEDQQRFDSKLERDRYLHLKQMRAIGVVDFFLRQVPFHLPGGIVYRLDFLVRWPPQHTAEPVGARRNTWFVACPADIMIEQLRKRFSCASVANRISELA